MGCEHGSFNKETAFLLGRTFAHRNGDQALCVAQAKQGCDKLLASFVAGFSSLGGNVINLGRLPLCVLKRFLLCFGANCGAVVRDDGISFYDNYGFELCKNDPVEVENEDVCLFEVNEPIFFGSDVFLGNELSRLFGRIDVKVGLKTVNPSYVFAKRVFSCCGVEVERNNDFCIEFENDSVKVSHKGKEFSTMQLLERFKEYLKENADYRGAVIHEKWKNECPSEKSTYSNDVLNDMLNNKTNLGLGANGEFYFSDYALCSDPFVTALLLCKIYKQGLLSFN